MKFLFPAILFLALTSCSSETARTMTGANKKEWIMLRAKSVEPAQAYRILWQRSYPEEHEELIRKKKSGGSDPFAERVTVPDSELTPSSFGVMSEWGKGLPRRVFEELGYPIWEMENGSLRGTVADVSYDPKTGTLKIFHLPEAINAFRERFPEFEEITDEPTN